jgi:dynamin 1-like protein
LCIEGLSFTKFFLSLVQSETDHELQSNKEISEKQLWLKIFSSHVLNITIVNLPDITKVPVGDQPSDIEAPVRTMILSYIKHKT